MNSSTGLTAVIVCGGRGSRLGPLGDVVNKNLLPYNGAPILLQAVSTAIKLFGCERIVFLTSHLADQVEQVAREYVDNVEIVFIRDDSRKGTAAAVQEAIISLKIHDFIYAHGNVAIGDKGLRQLTSLVSGADGCPSFLAVSKASKGPTHPQVNVRGHTIVTVDNPKNKIFSVGFGLIKDLTGSKKLHNNAGDNTLEDWLFDKPNAITGIKAIDIGTDWRHLETLNFYAEDSKE
jgi:GTP:adenosylcobinamide-phosphate guanylyltransferase